jgi:FOG: WD40 repeat
MQKLEDAQGDLHLKFDSFSKNLEKEVEAKWEKKFHEQNQQHAQQLANLVGADKSSLWRSIAPLRGHSGWVNTLAFTSDGKRLVSGSDSTVRVWDISTGTETGKFHPGGKTRKVVISRKLRLFCLLNFAVLHVMLDEPGTEMKTCAGLPRPAQVNGI